MVYIKFVLYSFVIITCAKSVFSDEDSSSDVQSSKSNTKQECSLSYLSLLHPEEDPVDDDDCLQDQQFTFIDGTVGPANDSQVGKLDRFQLFSPNIAEHAMEAKALLTILLTCKTFEDFKKASIYYKSITNRMLFTFVFSSAIINRMDCDTFAVPSLFQFNPDHFFQESIIKKSRVRLTKHRRKLMRKYLKRRKDYRKSVGRKKGLLGRSFETFTNENNKEFMKDKKGDKAAIMAYKEKLKQKQKNKKNRKKRQASNGPSETLIIAPDLTGNSKDPEHSMAYFREDIALNSHHWHWHLIYPLFWEPAPGLMIKDRKGELFYYMHNQILKRYTADRLSFNLGYIKPISLRSTELIVSEGYYSHLDSSFTGSGFSGRPKDLQIQSIIDNPLAGTATLNDMVKWYNSLITAISNGIMVRSNGQSININTLAGVDALGAAIEASSSSPNRNIYGNLHNTGHVLLSFIHDPTGQYNAPQGVMAGTETACRDPIFWRWHKFVDNVFAFHKSRLPAYTEEEVGWTDVEIESVNVQSTSRTFTAANQMHTYFKTRKLDLARGLDFEAAGDLVPVNITHLDHLPFTYTITATSWSEQSTQGHVRIFLSPKFAPDGTPHDDDDLRHNAFEMDRFTVNLNPGTNTITRSSRESAVTMVPGRQWTQLSNVDVEFSPSDDNDNFCGCGWPDHLLVPRGTPTGMRFVLIVAISDWSNEVIGTDNTMRTCDDSLTMCGLLGRRFPDQRAMGYPLDRPIPPSSSWFKRSNMIVSDITIFHRTRQTCSECV